MLLPKEEWGRQDDKAQEMKNFIKRFTFKQFCMLFEHVGYFKNASGFQRQCDYVINNKKEILVDFVGKYENLEKDWDYLCKNVFHHEYVLPHHRRSRHRKDYMSYYDEETRQKIADYYKEDFEIFGYDK